VNARERQRLLQAAEGYFRAGNAALAKMALQGLMAEDASSSRAFELLGYIHGNEGDLPEAHRCLERACRLPGAAPEAHFYLGVSLLRQGQPAAAVTAFDRALALAGPFFEALHERGTACSRLGRHAEALASYQRALRLRPRSFSALFNLGKVHDQVRDFGNALACYERALALDPRAADAWAHRGAVLYDLERYADAIDSWERALAIDPTIEQLPGFVLHARLRLCDWRDWEAQRAGLLARFERGDDVCGPFEMLAIAGDERLQLRCAQRWPLTHPAEAAAPAWPARAAADGRIRVAYVSADFRRHAVSHLLAGLFERHDRSRFELFAFALKPAAPGDEMRARLERAFDHFIDVSAMPDADVVARARSLQIDIAVDLGGHTKGSRTALLRDRLAPLQVNYLGYPGTMGADFIDYLIADETVVPAASRAHYSERIVWLPGCFQPSDPERQRADPPLSRPALGLPEGGFVFCCFNNTYKINPEVFASWMRILRAVPGACLWLLAESDAAQANLRESARGEGVAPDRLVFGGRVPMDMYLERFRHADLFLDTLPFNGGTTANDALFAGLPLLTRAGDAFAGRMAASLLRTPSARSACRSWWRARPASTRPPRSGWRSSLPSWQRCAPRSRRRAEPGRCSICRATRAISKPPTRRWCSGNGRAWRPTICDCRLEAAHRAQRLATAPAAARW
jgi:protein O-GlcNAc transferase